MIAVEVRLGAALRERLHIDDTGPIRVELAPGATLPDLYAALGIDPALVALCTVNNRYPPDGYALQPGDRLRLVSPVVGG
jgi:sulfur carrier protein ThiS